MKKKQRLQKDFTYLTLSMFVVVFVWIASNVYNAHVTTTIDEVLQIQIIPINGQFDTKTLESLQKRTVILPDYIPAVGSQSATTQNTNDQDQQNRVTPPIESNSITDTLSDPEISELLSELEQLPTSTIAPQTEQESGDGL